MADKRTGAMRIFSEQEARISDLEAKLSASEAGAAALMLELDRWGHDTACARLYARRSSVSLPCDCNIEHVFKGDHADALNERVALLERVAKLERALEAIAEMACLDHDEDEHPAGCGVSLAREALR